MYCQRMHTYRRRQPSFPSVAALFYTLGHGPWAMVTREAGPPYGAVTAVVAPSLATEENSGIKIQGDLMTLFF